MIEELAPCLITAGAAACITFIGWLISLQVKVSRLESDCAHLRERLNKLEDAPKKDTQTGEAAEMLYGFGSLYLKKQLKAMKESIGDLEYKL